MGEHENTRKESNQDDHAPDALPISKVVPSFLEYLRVEEGRCEATIIRYQVYLERMIGGFGDVEVTQIDGDAISRAKRQLLNSGLAAATISGYVSCLRSLLRYLRDVRHIRVFDAEKVRRPKIPKREVEFLTQDEIERFLAAIPNSNFAGVRDRALAEVLYATGLRISEALALNRSDIDWETREAKVVGKGNKERRVFFNDECLLRTRQYLAVRHDDEPALFVTQAAPQRLRAQGQWRRFRAFGRKAGLSKDVYPHMLRHTLATTLLTNGCPIGHIRTLLGHAHLATTCRYYLGMVSYAEAKVAHAKYLSQGSNQATKSDGAVGDEAREESRARKEVQRIKQS